MLPVLILFAQEATKEVPTSPSWSPIIWMIPVVVLFWLMILNPARRQERDRQSSLITGLKKNDKVLTSSGIYGTVVSVAEKEDEIVVKVDENCRLRMSKASVLRNLSQEEALKEQKEKK